MLTARAPAVGLCVSRLVEAHRRALPSPKRKENKQHRFLKLKCRHFQEVLGGLSHLHVSSGTVGDRWSLQYRVPVGKARFPFTLRLMLSN